MRILYLAEHYDPLVGGATYLSKAIASSVGKLGHDVRLIAPHSGSRQIRHVEDDGEHFRTTLVGAEVPLGPRFRGRKRRNYANAVNAYLETFLEVNDFDVVHILTGVYLIEYLNLNLLRRHDIVPIAGILNLPPQECGTSWRGDRWTYYVKDHVRRQLVRIVNARRICKQEFDHYTTISNHSKRLLSQHLDPDRITVIDLGCDTIPPDLKLKRRSKGDPIRLLTVAGYNPSKNLHVIPEVAAKLRGMHFDFVWDLIGPVRHPRYKEFIRQRVESLDLSQQVITHGAMPRQQLLDDFYSSADVYVQSSVEEGFCMSALDAVLYGVPLIGLSTGAIPEFVRDGRGIVAVNSPTSFAESISLVLRNPHAYEYEQPMIQQVVHKYSWSNIAAQYEKIYRRALNDARFPGDTQPIQGLANSPTDS